MGQSERLQRTTTAQRAAQHDGTPRRPSTRRSAAVPTSPPPTVDVTSVDVTSVATDRIRRSAGEGLPSDLQFAVEQLSGRSMDQVTVHRDSSAPRRFGALAFAQGADIHLGAGQEHHLPHEAWHVVQQAQGRVRPSVQAKTAGPVVDDELEREADVMGARAARLARSITPTPTIGSAVRASAPASAPPAAHIQLKAPAGWKSDDATTWEPDTYTGFDYTLVSDALSTLNLDAQRPLADKWATKALATGLVGKGPIRSTYKSSYDQDADAFSVSQDVPQIDQLVVHAHISPTDVVALDGGVNLKWKHDEGGEKAANIPSSTGSAIIDVATARAHWESNPDHDRAEEDAEERAIGRAIFNLFDTSKEDAERKAAAEKAKKESDTRLVNWGWANTIDKIKYGKRLKAVRDDPERFEKFLEMIRDAQARHAAKAAAAASTTGTATTGTTTS